MAAKNMKKSKSKEKKNKKTKEAKEEKIAVLKKTESKGDVPKIGAIVKDGLNEKLTYEEILKNVLKYHPESRFNRKHLSWYKNKLRAE